MKRFLKIICCLLIAAVPIVAIPTFAFLAPPVFQNTFVGALDEKVERLYSIEEPKLVVVGGSSVAFGLDSSIPEEYIGMPVVNFGLYGALGTKIMLDLSRDAIGEGDIVVIAPELAPQTLSLYFDADMTLRALDGEMELLSFIDSSHSMDIISEIWDFASDKLRYTIDGIPDPEGVYNSKYIDERGDLKYLRPENVMQRYYDPNTEIKLSGEIFSPDFIDYLNDYIASCEARGASVYFSFCPMNELALAEDYDPDEFCEFIEENINCTLISYPTDYIFEAGYFYDTNFHLNDAGVIYRSVLLTEDILLELGIPKAVRVDIPDAPALPEVDVVYFGEDKNAEYFVYEKQSSGAYSIVGIKDEYKNMKELTIPLGYNGYIVDTIGASAFADSSVEKVVLTEDTNIRTFLNGCFHGASNLRSLWIYYENGTEIANPTVVDGAHESFAIYVPDRVKFDTGTYGWLNLGINFYEIDK